MDIKSCEWKQHCYWEEIIYFMIVDAMLSERRMKSGKLSKWTKQIYVEFTFDLALWEVRV